MSWECCESMQRLHLQHSDIIIVHTHRHNNHWAGFMNYDYYCAVLCKSVYRILLNFKKSDYAVLFICFI